MELGFQIHEWQPRVSKSLKAKEGTIFYKILEKFPEAFQVLDPESSRKKNGNTKKMLMNVIASVFGDPLTMISQNKKRNCIKMEMVVFTQSPKLKSGQNLCNHKKSTILIWQK